MFRKYVHLKNLVQVIDGEKDDENTKENQEASSDKRKPNDVVAFPTTSNVRGTCIGPGKVTRYESEYINSSNPGRYNDTNDGSYIDDARRHKSSRKVYDPQCLARRFFLGS